MMRVGFGWRRRYMPSLDFKGKQFVYTHHLTVPFRELVVDAKKSLPAKGKPSMDDNLIIHGDNLHALKALLPRYAGKVKCIYIDPPYNTGNEGWCYNDNVRSPLMKEWVKHGNPVERRGHGAPRQMAFYDDSSTEIYSANFCLMMALFLYRLTIMKSIICAV